MIYKTQVKFSDGIRFVLRAEMNKQKTYTTSTEVR